MKCDKVDSFGLLGSTVVSRFVVVTVRLAVDTGGGVRGFSSGRDFTASENDLRGPFAVGARPGVSLAGEGLLVLGGVGIDASVFSLETSVCGPVVTLRGSIVAVFGAPAPIISEVVMVKAA
jgi:hypothetical protein